MNTATDIGGWSVLIAVIGAALRVSTPYLFVSLGETITELSGRINLGLEGTLIMGAVSGYAVSYVTGSPWLGVLAAGATGALFGLLHAGLCNLPRVNDIAVGVALFIFGTGLGIYLGKPLIHPVAPRLPDIHFGFWSTLPSLRAALDINALFIIGVVGVMVRRNIIVIFMSIELILNAVNINLVAYSNQLQNTVGQVFAIFVIAVAAAEAAVGLGIILAFYRNKETVNVDEMNLMKW